jgi:hypothetical protein
MLVKYTPGDEIPPDMVVFNNHLIHRDDFNALNISQAVAATPSPSSVPPSDSGALVGGLKKDARLEKFSGEEAGSADGWLEDAEVRFEMFKVATDMWLPEAIAALTGPAAAWGRKFCWENRSPTWERFAEQMRAQFTSKFADITIAREFDALMQTGSVKEYVEAHMKICQRAPANFDSESAMIRHIFMRNMKPYLYKLMDIGQCKVLADTYVEARNAEDKAHSSTRQNQGGDKNQGRQRGRWGDNNKRGNPGQDQTKDPEKPKFVPKKFGGQKPQQTSQLFNTEQAGDSSGSGKDFGAQ